MRGHSTQNRIQTKAELRKALWQAFDVLTYWIDTMKAKLDQVPPGTFPQFEADLSQFQADQQQIAAWIRNLETNGYLAIRH